MDEFRVLDDDQLAVLCMEGQVQAFATLVERHQTAVLRTCFLCWYPKVSAQVARSWAEDDAQEVFLKAFAALKRRGYRPQGKFLGWLRTIAERHCLDLRRRRAQEAGGLSLEEPRGEDRALRELVPCANPGPEEAHRAQTIRQALADFLGTLRPNERQAAMLRWFEQRSHADIAQLLGESEGAVRVKIHRLRARAARHPALQALWEDL